MILKHCDNYCFFFHGIFVIIYYYQAYYLNYQINMITGNFIFM